MSETDPGAKGIITDVSTVGWAGDVIYTVRVGDGAPFEVTAYDIRPPSALHSVGKEVVVYKPELPPQQE